MAPGVVSEIYRSFEVKHCVGAFWLRLRVLGRESPWGLQADDGEEGLRLAFDTTPDVILLDMLMPRLGGVQVLRALKQNPQTAHIPVIAMSSLPQSNESKLLREGAVSYLNKSRFEDSTALLKAIDKALFVPGPRRS